jgi:hypothetical protein
MAKIIGNTTATPNPRPDWNQTDETRADYIKNKPTSLSQFTNDTNFVSTDEIDDKITELLNSQINLTDSVTGVTYKLYVVNGKLNMEEML